MITEPVRVRGVLTLVGVPDIFWVQGGVGVLLDGEVSIAGHEEPVQ